MNQSNILSRLAEAQIENCKGNKVHKSDLKLMELILAKADEKDRKKAKMKYMKALNKLQQQGNVLKTSNTMIYTDKQTHKQNEIVAPTISEVIDFCVPLASEYGFCVQAKYHLHQDRTDVIQVIMEVTHVKGHTEVFKGVGEMELPGRINYASEVSATVSIVLKGLLKNAFGVAIQSNSSEASSTTFEDTDFLSVKLDVSPIAANVSPVPQSKSSNAAVEPSSAISDTQLTQLKRSLKNKRIKETVFNAYLFEHLKVDAIENLTYDQVKDALDLVGKLAKEQSSKAKAKSSKLQKANS